MSYEGSDHVEKAKYCLRHCASALDSLISAKSEEAAQFSWENFLDQVVKANRFIQQAVDRILKGHESGARKRKIRKNGKFQYLLHARNCMGYNPNAVAENEPEYLDISAPGAPRAMRLSAEDEIHIIRSAIGDGFVGHLSHYPGSRIPRYTAENVKVKVVERLFLKDALDSGEIYSVPQKPSGRPVKPEELAKSILRYLRMEINTIEKRATKESDLRKKMRYKP